MYACMYGVLRVRKRVYVSMYVCTYVCMYVCMYVWRSARVYVSVRGIQCRNFRVKHRSRDTRYICIYIYTYVHTHMLGVHSSDAR